MKLSKLPTAKWKSFKAFKADNESCQQCAGSGRRYLWEDRDPIEGYKLASKKPCPDCGGQGKLSDNDIRELYNSYQSHISKTRERVLKRRIEEQSALERFKRSTLTRRDLVLLAEMNKDN